MPTPRERAPSSPAYGLAAALLALLSSCGELPHLADPLLSPLGDHDGLAETPAATEEPPEAEAHLDLDDGADWLQLSSGEWLRGSLVRLRLEKLTFRSNRVGEQTFDLGGVKRLIGVGHSVVLTGDGRTFEGAVTADEESIWIAGEKKTVRLPRSELLALLAVADHGLSAWSGGLSLGATFRTGNTDQTDYTTLARVLRESARSRWAAKYVGAISSVNDAETTNNHRLDSQFDVYLTQRAFLTVPGIEVYRDRFQNIDLRVTPSISLGYDFLDIGPHRCALSIGPALQYIRLRSGPNGDESEDTTAAGVFSTDYSWRVSREVNLHVGYDLTMPIPDVDEYNHHLLARLGVNLPGNLHLDVSFIWDRVNQPSLEGSGTRPQPDDFRTTVGLGWSF